MAFLGDSRIRQLFYSFIKILDPERREDGNKVIMGENELFKLSLGLKAPTWEEGMEC